MTNIDDKITQALEADEAELFREYDSDLDLDDILAGVHRGKGRWFIYMIDFAILMAFVFTIVMAWRFFAVEELKRVIMYATLFLVGTLGTMLFKQMYWMQVNRNSTIREIKRVELQLAFLAKRLGTKSTEG